MTPEPDLGRGGPAIAVAIEGSAYVEAGPRYVQFKGCIVGALIAAASLALCRVNGHACSGDIDISQLGHHQRSAR